MDQDNQNRLQAFDSGIHRRLNSRGRGYTSFVKVTKLLLPVAALFLVGIVTFRLSGPTSQTVLPEKDSSTKTEAGQIELEGARYEGNDASGRGYTVSADIASRQPENEKTVLLTAPKAQMMLNEKTAVTIMAAKGSFDTEASHLQLDGDVRLTHDDGYELKMPDLAIDVTNREAVTNSPIEGSGPAGTVKATGLAIENKGDLIVFKGPAVLTITQKPSTPRQKDIEG